MIPMSLLLGLYRAAIVAVHGWAALVGPHPSLPYRKVRFVVLEIFFSPY